MIQTQASHGLKEETFLLNFLLGYRRKVTFLWIPMECHHHHLTVLVKNHFVNLKTKHVGKEILYHLFIRNI